MACALQVYYHNTVTQESTWQKPEGFNGQIATAKGTPVPIASEDIPLTGWAEVTCIDGRKYFYHADRQVSTYSTVRLHKLKSKHIFRSCFKCAMPFSKFVCSGMRNV